MSNWSSFEDDKKYIDAWRNYLTESEEEIELDEGFWDRLKTTAAGAKEKLGTARAKWHDAKVAGRSAKRQAKLHTGYAVDPLMKVGAGGGAGATAATGSADDAAATDDAVAGTDAAPSTPGMDPEDQPQIQMPDAPVTLFTGEGALYSKLFTQIMQRFNNKEIAGGAIKLDKKDVQNTVKQILKDLSAQLRVNGVKVQESTIPVLADLIVEELERTLITEAQGKLASRSARRRAKVAAQAEKGAQMGTDTAYTSTATAGRGKPSNAAEKWVAAGKPKITTVSGNNLVTRDADHYANAEKGTLKPDALEFAKAQVAWLQQNKSDQNIPDVLTKAIQTTEADPEAKNYGADKTGTGARVEPQKGQVDAFRAVAGKVTALIGQAAGADIADREQRKMVTTDIQQDLKGLVMKIVKPHLQKHLQAKDIKLRETKASTNEKK
mgnify:CR=1 FL=1